MFNIQSQADIQEFKLRQFASCYRLFFATTLPYESISMCARMKLYEKANTISDMWLANAFGVGMAVQYISNPLFKLNLANHNYRLGDTSSH
jgi:hypothetical protein